MTNGIDSTPLTFTHLRFQARALQFIHFGQYQGAERLRDALAQVMLRSVCPETNRMPIPTPEHAAICPVCWLLAAQADPGIVRRIYSLAGPYPPPATLTLGQEFQFTVTLFGDGIKFLPYFVLAASAMGDAGIGPGRGKFEIISIQMRNPLIDKTNIILAEGEKIVRLHNNPINWNNVETFARKFPPEGNLRIRFLSPTRLVAADSLVKAPDFGLFFRRLLERIDELAKQYNGAIRRPAEEIANLYQLADEVHLIEQSTQWINLWGPSGRTGHNTPMSGFVGFAVYRSKHWDKLLPWLLLGQGVQVGKLTIKGNGVFQVELNGIPGYWTGC